MKLYPLLAFAVPVLLSSSCKKSTIQKVVTSDNKLVTEKDKMVDAIVRNYAAKQATAGFSIALVERSSSTVNINYYNYGEVERGGRMPTSKTAYEIGSITKTFTSLGIVASAIDSLGGGYPVFLAANPAHFLPGSTSYGFTLNGTTTKVSQLLNHQSGLPRLPKDLANVQGYNASNPYAHYDSLKVYSYLSTHAPGYTPGDLPSVNNLEERYSNLAFAVAGLILERTKKMSLEKVFRQLLLSSSIPGLDPDATAYGSFADQAKGHGPSGNVVPYWNPMGGFAGAGGLKSNAESMARLLDAYLANGTASSTLNPSTSQAMAICTTPSVKLNGENLFGYGWEFFKLTTGKELTVKDGATGGSAAFVAFHKGSGKALVMLSNNNNANGQSAVFLALAESFFK